MLGIDYAQLCITKNFKKEEVLNRYYKYNSRILQVFRRQFFLAIINALVSWLNEFEIKSSFFIIPKFLHC